MVKSNIFDLAATLQFERLRNFTLTKQHRFHPGARENVSGDYLNRRTVSFYIAIAIPTHRLLF